MTRERFRNEVGELGGFGSLGYGKEDMGREGRTEVLQKYSTILLLRGISHCLINASASSSLLSSQYIFVFKFKVSIL
jgi:hypothetical protein